MIVIKRKISFYLEKRKKNGVPIEKNVPIIIRVTYCGYKFNISTGFRVDYDSWDEGKQRVTNGCFNKQRQSSSRINMKLSEYTSLLEELFFEFEYADLVPTEKEFKDQFYQKTQKTQKKDKKLSRTTNKPPKTSHSKNKGETVRKDGLERIIKEFVNDGIMNYGWTKSTIQKFTTLKNQLYDFNPRLEIDSFTEEVLSEFMTYLKDKRQLVNVSREKQLKLLRWFLKWAAKKDYHGNMGYDTFRPKFKKAKKQVVFLSEKEITKLSSYKIPSHKIYLDRVRDVFLFCCYTGLRYSDVSELRRSDIKPNHLEITTVKTNDFLTINHNRASLAILKKYEGIRFSGDRVLPVVSNQKMNEYLKELCELAKIDDLVRETHYYGSERVDRLVPKYELISSHTGRRSFISNAIANGVPAEVVMKWTGHSDYKAMAPYIEIAENSKKEAMSKLSKIWEETYQASSPRSIDDIPDTVKTKKLRDSNRRKAVNVNSQD